MSHNSSIYSSPVKTCSNEYIFNLNDRHGAIELSEEPVSNSSPMFLKMFEDHRTANVSSRNINNLADLVDNNFSSGDNSSSGCPSFPSTKPPQRTFMKERTDLTNTMPSQYQNEERYRGRSLIDRHNTRPTPKRAGSTNSPETQLKTVAANDYNNDIYLTPADSPQYVDSTPHFCGIDSQSGSTDSETSNTSFHNRGWPTQRMDSGVGDCESGRGSSSVRFSGSQSCSSNSMSNHRLSVQHEQQYEDIDQFSKTGVHIDQFNKTGVHRQPPPKHQSQRASIEKLRADSVRSGTHPLPPVEIAGITNSDSEDNDRGFNRSLAEAITETMHNPHIGSLPHTYMPLRASVHKNDTEKPVCLLRGSCWFIVAFFIILIISLAALSLSIFVLVSIKSAEVVEKSPTEITETSADYGLNVSNLQQKIDDLIKENTALKEVLLTQQGNLTSYVQEVNHLSSQQQIIGNTLQLMEVNFDAKIANISLTPGPEGPPGIANFSLCVNQTITKSAIASHSAPTETRYMPEKESDLKSDQDDEQRMSCSDA